MAGWGVEAGTCFGRGFDAGGFMGKFKAWITKSYANHGPNWYIVDDQSGLTNNPYIVVCDQVSPSGNSLAKFVYVLLPNFTGGGITAVAGQIQFRTFNYWDSSTHIGSVAQGGSSSTWSNLPTSDAGTFSYDFRGGIDGLFIGTLVGQAGIIDWFVIDNLTYISDDFCENPATKIGTLQSDFYKEFGDSTNLLGGYENITGVTSSNLDASGIMYFSIVLVSGTTYHIELFKDSARTQLIGFSANFTNTATGTHTITASNSSGIGGTISSTATVSANTAISCRFPFRVDVGTGEGANFTVGKFYYLTDFSQGAVGYISYLQIASIVGDTLTFAAYPTGKPFLAGTKIGSYPHFYYVGMSRIDNSTSGAMWVIPYVSLLGTESTGPNSNNTRQANLNYLSTVMNPNDEGKYSAIRPILNERYSFNQSATGMNREYGQAKNMFIGVTGGMSIYLQGRTINGKNYLYFNSSVTGLALMILDTESLS